MSKLIYALADIMARPLAFLVVTAAFIIPALYGFLFGAPDRFMNGINLSISLLTMLISHAVLVTGRRDGLAEDVKLNRIIEEQPGDNDAIGIETMTAEELEEKKREVEERTGNDAGNTKA